MVELEVKSESHYISPSAVTFTENYLGQPMNVGVSIVQGASIMVYRPGEEGLGYGADLDYQRWKLSGVSVQLNAAGADKKFEIYARLSRNQKEADIIFSLNNYNLYGEYTGADGGKLYAENASNYWYIKIGYLTAPVSNVRTLYYDSGKLGTRKDEAERSDLFELVSTTEPKRIRPKWGFSEIVSYGVSLFYDVVSFVKGIEIGERIIASVAPDDADGSASEQSDDQIATPRYVQSHGDQRYLNKLSSEAQEVAGIVTFLADLNVDGNLTANTLDVAENASVGRDLSVSGSSTIGGDQSIQGNQTIDGELNITKNGTDDDNPAITIGDFIEQGDIIQGAQVTKDGIASFAKVKTPSMQVYELTLNRKTAVQGEFVFSDGETIEEVTRIDDDTYRIRVREPYDGYITTFKVDDVLYSNINIIGEPASPATTGKCWMFVTEVDGDTIIAKHYPSNQCPSGENIAPMPHMTITRHGNRRDKTRQDLFIISSETSSLTMLRGVDAPIVSSEGLYGVVLGKLPSTLLDYIKEGGYKYVNSEDPYIYARGVIVQDLIMLDYQGKPIRQENYRGHWSAEIAETNPYNSSPTAYDTVTHNGSLWMCMISGTEAEPREDIADWTLKISKGDDSTATMYELKPSANIIYYRTADKKLSINTLDVKVGQTTSHGYSVIDEQYVLEELGLKVSYAIDGVGERHDINISPVAAFLLEDGTAVIATEEGYGLSLEGDVIDVDSIEDNITLYLTDTTTGEDMATYIIPVVKDGEEGKEGKRGRMLYPAGVYDDTKEYMIENNSAPFVKEGSTYYVLVWEGGSVNGIQPSTDTQGIYWRPFTYMNYLFAEFLMANFAKFGGDNGGVFYDRYLFSQDGVTAKGEDASFSDYADDIFDSDGNLSDIFTPNLLFNFKNGEAVLGKLTEVYHRYPADTGLIRMGDYHNIIVTPDAGRYGDSLGGGVQGFSSPLIILPQMQKTKWSTNGAHISIFADVGDYYKYPLEGLNDAPVGGVYKQMSAFALISADDILDGVGLRTRGIYSGNWIVANGYRSKFMLLSPGCMIKLRLSYNENTSTSDDETYNWVVEGGNEVQVTKSQIFARDLHWSSPSEATSKVPYQGYEWDRINNRGATLEFNWQAGGDENHPYYPVILTVGHVGDNLGATTINKDGVYLGHTKPNILLSTTQNGEGWYGGCYYRLLDALNDEGYPDTDLE